MRTARSKSRWSGCGYVHGIVTPSRVRGSNGMGKPLIALLTPAVSVLLLQMSERRTLECVIAFDAPLSSLSLNDARPLLFLLPHGLQSFGAGRIMLSHLPKNILQDRTKQRAHATSLDTRQTTRPKSHGDLFNTYHKDGVHVEIEFRAGFIIGNAPQGRHSSI